MIGQGFMEEMNGDVFGDFVNHIDDLLDFSNEAIDGGDGIGGGGFDGCWPVATEVEALFGSAYSSSTHSVEDDFAAELSVSCDDIAQLEWLSSFVEDSFSAEKIDISSDCKSTESLFQTSSPVSVLEPRPSILGPDTVVPGRARSKRPRPPSFSRAPQPKASAEESEPEAPMKKKSKKKMKKLVDSVGLGDDSAQQGRKCKHCGIEKTPQWRMGPMGPKTLCNACGVRYKSGRLFPEYRPAASPTFVPALHSNSHKKVMQMRIKSEFPATELGSNSV